MSRAVDQGVQRVRRAVGRRVELFTEDVIKFDLNEGAIERANELGASRLPEETTFHRGTDEQDTVLRSVLPESRLRLLGERMQRGEECQVAFVAGEPAGWLWTAVRSHRDEWSGRRVHLGPGDCYLYDLWTFPGRRRGGLGLGLMVFGMKTVWERGFQVIYGTVNRDNVAAQRLYKDVLGFVDVQKVRHVRVLGKGIQVPFSARPRGPFSWRGPHRDGAAGPAPL